MAEVCHGPEQGSSGRGEVVAIDGTQFSLENVRREVLSVRTCRSKASLGRYTPKDNAEHCSLSPGTGFSARTVREYAVVR